MTTFPFASPDDLKIFLAQSLWEQFKTTLPHFSFSELAESFVLLQTQPVIDAHNKLNALFQFVNSPANLEILGKHCSISSFLSFLDFLSQHPSYQNRLTFVLVGLHPFIFSQALPLFQTHHLTLLKLESLFEPLHYHLTQFIHEGDALHQQIEHQATQFQQDLTFIKPEELTQNTLEALIQQIDTLSNHLLDYLERVKIALSIAWHTDRVDLIEKLSSLNETLQHQLLQRMGYPSLDNFSATGLYAILEQHLANIFDSSLTDGDASVEGLTRLSIWYLKDYWELGLLPFIPHLQELELDPQQYSEEERLSHQQRLFQLVQQQLERLKIGTVGGLKKAHLFSKPLLQTYIKQHQHLLQSTHHNLDQYNA